MGNIPSKDRPEWKELLNIEREFDLKNFVLQMKVTQARKDIKKGKKTLTNAIDEIHALCEKYALAVKQDMETVFNNN